MKKKVVVTVLALAVVVALAFGLVACTVSGTYTSTLMGEIKFSGKSFTYTSKLNTTTEGTFEAKKADFTEDEKASLTLLGLSEDTVKGSIVLKDKNDKEVAVGFYGKEDGKDYVALIGTVTGTFEKE